MECRPEPTRDRGTGSYTPRRKSTRRGMESAVNGTAECRDALILRSRWNGSLVRPSHKDQTITHDTSFHFNVFRQRNYLFLFAVRIPAL